MFVVLANATLANYFQGGGHWAWFLQFPLGLRQLGHRIFWLEIMPSTGNDESDQLAVRNFFGRLAEFGLERDACSRGHAKSTNAGHRPGAIVRAQCRRA
jgi:hypothetical protein